MGDRFSVFISGPEVNFRNCHLLQRKTNCIGSMPGLGWDGARGEGHTVVEGERNERGAMVGSMVQGPWHCALARLGGAQ